MAKPEPYHVILSLDAEKELEKIFEYIAQHSPTNASNFIAQILNAMDGLEFSPLRQVVKGRSALRIRFDRYRSRTT
jgi:plasmid stabilization system protein ParE